MYATQRDLLEMFTDKTAGESTQFNRLITREVDADTVALIGYGWLKLAEYNEERGVVTVFTGHKSIRSQTVSRWLNTTVSVSEDRGRDVVLSGESPTVDTPNGGVEYIRNYISMGDDMSAVEFDARNEVIDQLRPLA